MSRAAIIIFCFACQALLAADYAKWAWSRELPKEIGAASPAANRSPAALDKLFQHGSPTPSIGKVIDTLGKPDGFSRQALGSLTKGTAQPQKVGGTLRFLLSGGGELHVRTGDFHLIFEAIRYDKSGRGNLLAK